MHIPQVNAKGGILLWWGKFRFVYGHAATYVGMIQMALIVAVAYNTTLRPWIVDYLGWDVTFWQYCVVLGALLLVGMVLEFALGVPAFLAIANEQWYKHGNPIKTDIDIVKAGLSEMKSKQTETDEKLAKIMKRLEIE